MKVIITKTGLPVTIGTIMDVGDAIPKGWDGKCEPLNIVVRDPLDHDGDGRKGGSLPKAKRRG